MELHRKLLADSNRNSRFAKALQAVVRPGAHVADIGAGTGFLSFLACKHGASKCHLYEADREISELSKRIAADSGIPASQLHFVAKHSSSVGAPPACDVVISETLGCFALEENLLANMIDARRFLRGTGAVLIPGKLRQYIAPVVTPAHERSINSWDPLAARHGLSFAAAKASAYRTLYQLPVAASDLLADAARCWDEIDLRTVKSASRPPASVAWQLRQDGTTVYGFCLWWEADLVPHVVLSTSPEAPATHWEQAYLPLLAPLQCHAGDGLQVALSAAWDPAVGAPLRWAVRHTRRGRLLHSEQNDDEPSARRARPR